MECFMNSCELLSFITSIACLMSNSLDDKCLEVLSAVFTQLGDSLATILANRNMLDTKK